MSVDVKNRSQLPPSCEGCKYRKYLSESYANVIICNYISDVGKPRGCSIHGCTRYVKADTDTEQTQTSEVADTVHA